MKNPLFRLAANAVAAACWLGASPVQAQTATIYGSLGNFDVSNNTGANACGFEVEVQGLSSADIGGGFSVQRYGSPSTSDFAGGAYVRWTASVDPVTHQCSQRTVPHPSGVNFAGTCYQWNGAVYDNSGCEHFGVYLLGNPSAVLSRWLVPDANGVLQGVNPPVAVAQPSYYVIAPARAGDAPQVEVVVEAPEPPEAPEVFGDAQWMRIFVAQVPREVTLDELVSDNAIVPQDATKLETDWQLVQADPPSGNGRRNRGQHRNRGSLLPTTRAVVRRIEMSAYTGVYDPVTHEALCADGLCNAPSPGEMGDLISAQMTAVLVQSDSVTVTKSGTGSGNVDSADKRIACGNKCVAPYDAGQAVTLSVKAASGSTFTGWTGACAGTATSCTVSAVGHVDVGAVFTAAAAGGGGGGGGAARGFKLSVSRNNNGAVTSNVAGISCGNTCSASFASGTVVTLTATPVDGKAFLNWSGACTGTAAVCTVTMSKDSSVQAVFSK